jgi:hypothetical protein
LSNFIKIKNTNISFLERFGIFYLSLFQKKYTQTHILTLSDDQIIKKTNAIIRNGIIWASIIGIACVLPTIWIDLYFQDATFLKYWSWLLISVAISIIIELYLLFILALRLVHNLSNLMNVRADHSDFIHDGLFSVKNILARTALEIPDPELEILGIDPFKRISKKNLFLIGLLYKAKIFLTNIILKNILLFYPGKTIFGLSVLYEAIPVECFWNGVVVKRVVNEARLRLFGFSLSNAIINKFKEDKILLTLSTEAQNGCLRAIGNAVVMTQNYHPNMIILLVSFQQELGITNTDRYDDWNLFIETLNKVSIKERYFLLDLFTVAAAFDGRISALEERHLQEAYGNSFEKYIRRLRNLTQYLKEGKYNAALQECSLDFNEG